MRSGVVLLCLMICGLTICGQEKMYIHKSDNITLGALISSTDSIYFNSNHSQVYFKIGSAIAQYSVSDIDSISFGDNSNTVYITYDGTSVSVVNPLAFEGVSVAVNGADVTITSTIEGTEVCYSLSGSTSDGMLKIYSDYKFSLVMNGVDMTNSNGPAINIQSKKRCKIELGSGTTNTLTDGSSYATSSEDQKSTLFSEGSLVFDGTGSLTIKSNAKHAICSDDYVDIQNGTIVVSGAKNDGIHANDYFQVSGGTLTITSTGDGIQCEDGYILISGGAITTTNTSADVKGITCDSTMVISGGTINMTVNGNQSKGLKSGQQLTLSGGTITINTAGAVVLESSGSGYDPSYCTAIKCDSAITISGANITIVSTGKAGKGISSDTDIAMTSGTVNIATAGAGATYTNSSGVTDSYASSCMDADGNISIIGGSIIASSSGAGGKGITADGNLTFGDSSSSPTVNVTTTGTRFLVSGTSGYATAEYANPKAIKSDGILTVNNGTFTISTTNPGGEGFDSDSTLIVSGGTIGITIAGDLTKGIKADRAMTFSGGSITIKTPGGVVLETSGSGYDPSYCTGIKGDEDIVVCGANITITSTGKAGKGISSDTNISISSGTVSITTSGAGATYTNSNGTTDSYSATCITADGNISITGGTVITSSSGLAGKGISATGAITFGDASSSPVVNITTSGAKFLVSGTDYCHPKAIKCDGAIVVNNGAITISSTDDGIHSETSFTINSGTISITSSVEGIESKYITLSGGSTSIVASDDGINATAGTTSGGTETNDGSYLYLYGGNLSVNVSTGDGLDSNGSIVMTGGTVIVQGPPSQPELGVDYNGTFNISGGVLIISGPNSGNMIQTPSTTSTQYCVKATTTSFSAGTLFHIQDASGNSLVTYAPVRSCYYFIFSSSELKSGSTYYIYTGGTSTGTNTNGFYSGGTYSGGTQRKSFSVSSKVTSVTF